MRTFVWLLALLLITCPCLHADTSTGKYLPYTISLPDGWKPSPLATAPYDYIFTKDNLTFLGVIAEPTNVPQQILAEDVQKHFEAVLTNPNWSKTVWVQLDKGNWTESFVTGATENHSLTYIIVLHAGPEGSYQLIGWSTEANFAKVVNDLLGIIKTFQFNRDKIGAGVVKSPTPTTPATDPNAPPVSDVAPSPAPPTIPVISPNQ